MVLPPLGILLIWGPSVTEVPEALVPRFRHQPLATESDGIRLLRNIKETKRYGGIPLEIRHKSLNDKPTSGALSYAWGNDAATHRIWLFGLPSSVGIFHVRRNAWDFLQEAQQLADKWTREWIWIDQICLNQADHTGRCRQVSQMARLYSSA
jgi:hypothetical protein